MLQWILLLGILTLVPTYAKESNWGCSTTGNVETCDFQLDPKGISVSATSAANSQQQANWCWLASIEMAFRFYGYIVPQKELLDLLWGNIQDMPGRPEQILGATNRVYVDDNGKRFRSESIQEDSWLAAGLALGKNIPVLLGYAQSGGVGHMTMMIGLRYQALYNPLGQIIDTKVSEVVVWDPWPGIGIRDLTPEEFSNAFSLIGVGATPLDMVSIATRPKDFTIPFRFSYNLLGRTPRTH